ncbi:MAG: universal stress protein [Myxococcota bacterium]
MIAIRRILVPVDFSSGSRPVLEYAAGLAQRFDAEIEVLHVLEPPRYIAPDLVLHIEEGGPQTLGQFLRARAMRDMEQLLGSVPQRGEKRARPRIEMGDVAQTIANIAAEPGCDLVVMGTHGRQGLGHLLLGSVAAKVIRRAPCPVLTLRAWEEGAA